MWRDLLLGAASWLVGGIALGLPLGHYLAHREQR